MASSVNRNLEHEFDMEYNNNNNVRRLSIRLDYDNEEDYGDDGFMYVEELLTEEEEEKELDVIIVSHILSKTEQGEFDCPICLEENIEKSKRVTISCNHNFCMSCTVQLLKSCNEQRTNVACPMCRYPCFLLETPDEPQFNELGELLEELAELYEIIDDDDETMEDSFRYYHYIH
jgi:hypothetical protein